MCDQLMIAKKLPHRVRFDFGPSFADGSAVAVCVAICSQGGGKEEIAPTPGVFVAGRHFVGKPDLVVEVGGARGHARVATMAVAACVCSSR